MPRRGKSRLYNVNYIELSLLSNFIWKHKVLAPCPCECETNEDIVCGKDGKTYLNPCLAHCLGGLEEKVGLLSIFLQMLSSTHRPYIE